MKKLLFTSLILLIVNSAFTQTTYTFTGTGNWTDTANWQNSLVPPCILPFGSTIIINHANGGECVLNKAQTIAAGATFTILTGKFFRVTGSLFMEPEEPAYKLHGLGFSPYWYDQNPNNLVQISESQISYLLQRIAPYTNWVRSYGTTHGLEKIGVNARKQCLNVAAGAWLDNNPVTNQQSIANLIAMGKAGEIDVAVVGNETSLIPGFSRDTLLKYIRRVKDSLPGIKVTTGELYRHFLEDTNLVNAVDVIYAHIYPYWEGTSIDCATYMIDDIYSDLLDKSRGKEVVVAETGWPSDGNPVGSAVPSPSNAAKFFLHFISWARAKQVKYFYFEAFDEPWKQIPEGPQGAHWGLWEKNAGLLKPGMDSVFHGFTVPNNWVLDSAAIEAEDTSVSFTFVPPLGVQQDVQGIVKGVFPGDYKVAVYIYANCGWYPKPTYVEPFSRLKCDGSFSCYINDVYETVLRAYLVPDTFPIPAINDPSMVPMEVVQNAVAWTEVLRPATFVPILFGFEVDSITVNAARSGGNIPCDGGAPVTARGVCWNTTGNPTIDDPKTSDGTGSSYFYSIITGLNDSTNYYLRAYATNSAGTVYGAEKSFRTAYGLPVLTTAPIGNFLSSSKLAVSKF